MPDFSDIKESFKNSGAPKKNYRSDDFRFNIARTVMRNPDSDVKEKLYEIHEALKNAFESMSDESLDWLLGGSREMARGGFHTPNQLREFLRSNPKDISTSRLITGIE